MKWTFSLLYVLPAVSALSALPRNSSATTAVIDLAVVKGVNVGAVTKYLGIPYAKAARFSLPVPIPLYYGSIDASAYGPVCPAQLISSSSLSKRSIEYGPALQHLNARASSTEVSEDCLSINIIQPAGTRPTDKLPVVVWIYGGGFETGDTPSYDDLGTTIVARSVELGTPVVYVAMNYRISAYGFLASADLQKEKIGNFGLYDQRVALRWTKKYIKQFGGDASKITLWGQSAGAISASLQMLAYGGNTENLFRAAFMQSGAPIPVDKLSKGQNHYDFLVAETNCTRAANTLRCLRNVPFAVLDAAINKTPNYLSYEGLSLTWTPRADGVFLHENPFKQIKAGRVPKIPIVSGSCDDEGTYFSLAQWNTTTEDDFRNYVKTLYAPAASAAEISSIAESYPSTPSAGSPFDTGDANVLYPQYKRIAAFQGDLVFQAPRRNFIQAVSPKQKVWSYLSKVYKPYSALGAYHYSDIDAGVLNDYLINFVVTMNPNSRATPSAWPQYTRASPKLYTFTDNNLPSVVDDTFRAEPIRNLIQISSRYPL